MLSDSEKEKIKHEEIFRLEIQKTLETQTKNLTFGRKIWKLLNTSFALWFLSTVIVGLVTLSYSSFKSTEEKKTANLELERKLNLEISFRLQNSIIYIHSLEKDIKDSTLYFSKGGVAKRVLEKINNVGSEYTSPEFKERNFISLLYELRSITNNNQLAELVKSIDGYKRIYNISIKEFETFDDDKLSEKKFNEVVDSINEIQKIIEKEIMAEKWKL